jgi:uncharacterized membrane protein
MLTAGLGAFFYGRNRSEGEVSRFLLTRGLWLMFLELTVMHFALYFNFDYSFVILTVLWGLGIGMVVLAALIYLPRSVLAALCLAMIALHNLADGVDAARFGALAPVWHVVHQVGTIQLGKHTVLVSYLLVPWVGVMGAGYCLGPVFLRDPASRQRILFRLGLGLTAAFLLLRGLNVYGDPAPWHVQPTAAFTVLSFLRCNKYPPSLDFLLMTLGPALMAMSWLDRLRLTARNPLLVFGRVPLFYFLLHLFVIHLVAMLLALLRYGTASFFFNQPLSMGGPPKVFPANYGYRLWVVYVVWLAVVVMLYPLCRWFANLKERRRDWWLSYL